MVDRARVAAGESLPLAGPTFAVKDNIDVAGLPTTAGVPGVRPYRARCDAPVGRAHSSPPVRSSSGKTNLDQFATGLVGTRSPYGICPNAHWPGLVSGGSSSGSAVAVARGLVDLALGTDTAGSGRVPAACNGIVGLKPTTRPHQHHAGSCRRAGRSTACRCSPATVDLAALAAATRRGRDPTPTIRGVASRRGAWHRPRVTVRIGVPAVASARLRRRSGRPARFAAALSTGSTAMGVELCADRHRARSRDAAACSTAARSWPSATRRSARSSMPTAHRERCRSGRRQDHQRAGELPAWRCSATAPSSTACDRSPRRTGDVDVLVVPTVPRVPTSPRFAASPIAVNAKLGTYTNFVNLLDLCALIPSRRRRHGGSSPVERHADRARAGATTCWCRSPAGC